MIHNESSLAPYDAVLLVSFGGPERDEDVVPFLRNVTAGKDIPDERLKVVGEHYFGFGGKSPINDQNKVLMQALERELGERGISMARGLDGGVVLMRMPSELCASSPRRIRRTPGAVNIARTSTTRPRPCPARPTWTE